MTTPLTEATSQRLLVVVYLMLASGGCLMMNHIRYKVVRSCQLLPGAMNSSEY